MKEYKYEVIFYLTNYPQKVVCIKCDVITNWKYVIFYDKLFYFLQTHKKFS